MPKSKFWPLKLYKEKFGDPKAMPAPGPWRAVLSCHSAIDDLLSCYFCQLWRAVLSCRPVMWRMAAGACMEGGQKPEAEPQDRDVERG